jgi:RNA polymerase sigma-70 factor (ECF subfamily)
VAEVPEGVEQETPERLAQNRERQRRLTMLLEALNPEQRAVFVMFEVEGIGCQEIADTTGVAVGTVYSRLHTARKLVRERAAKLFRIREPGVEP